MAVRREEIIAFPLTCVFEAGKVGRTECNLRIRLNPFDGSGVETKPRDTSATRSWLNSIALKKMRCAE
jgi:hypothetical protein